VRAVNAAGSSGPSNELTLALGLPPEAPPAPSGLTAAAVGTTVTLTWVAPVSPVAPTSYIIDVGGAPGLSNVASYTTGSSGTTITATGVPNGTYYLRVRATNGSATSGPSNEVVLTVE
jgi:predicted phage tail protein